MPEILDSPAEVGSIASGSDSSQEELSIPRDSYTALRLFNSTAEQVDQDSRVTIIGPYPVDWIKRNKESWGRKRFAMMKQALPQMTNTLKKFTRYDSSSRDSIEQLNSEIISQLDLSPSTTHASDIDEVGSNGDEDDTDDNARDDEERFDGSVSDYSGSHEDDNNSADEGSPQVSNGIMNHSASTLQHTSSGTSFSKRYLLHNVTEEEDEEGDTQMELQKTGEGIDIPDTYRPPMPHAANSSATSTSHSSSYVTAQSSLNGSAVDLSAITVEPGLQAAENYSIPGDSDDDKNESDSPGAETPKVSNDFQSEHPDSSQKRRSIYTVKDNDNEDARSFNESTTTITPKPSRSGLAVSTTTTNNDLSNSNTNTTTQPSTIKDYLNSLLELDSSSEAGGMEEGGIGKKVVRISTGNHHTAPLRYGKYLTDTVTNTVGQAVGTTAGITKRGIEFGASGVSRGGRGLKKGGSKLMNVSAKKILRRKTEGEIVRIDKLLVAVKMTSSRYLPPDFNEMEPVETRLLERWKEYIVVARNTGNDANPILLQFYTTRNIAKIEDSKAAPKSKWDVRLGPEFQVNLFSSLDKSLALWKPTDKGTYIYLFQTRSNYSALAWLAFLAGVIGTRRENIVHLSIPDLGVKTDVNLPTREIKKLLREKPPENVKLSELDSYIASPSRPASMLFHQSLESVHEVDYLRQRVENEWKGKVKLGLVWRRYDRLEWVYDVNESQFQSSWAMARTHHLELRPKTSYARPVVFEDGKHMIEPSPVEGFLTRHSSWSGESKHNKLFFRKTYLHTHDNLLFYCRAMKAVPPFPEGYDRNVDSVESFARDMPTYFEVQPFCVDPVTGMPEWLKNNLTREQFEARDKAALFEIQRRVICIERSDGFLDLRDISSITPINSRGEDGEDEDDEENSNDESETSNDHNNVHIGTEFKITLNSGAILRLEAHNRVARDKWVMCLSELARYWQRKSKEDVQRLNDLRQKNLNILQIDEDMDALVSEAAPKWETERGVADPLSYTISGVSWSRSVHLKGLLYQKPSKFSTFNKYYCVLCYGDLILHSPYDRDSSGVAKPGLSYDRVQTIPLRDCYVYSGALTSTNLLNRDKWFDKNNPGRHALPRAYTDGWKSAEEESVRCFVLWFAKKRVINLKKKLSREDSESGDNGLKMVNRLGVTGTGMVFMARSRQERDKWVTALKIEIGRLANNAYEDVSIT